MIKKQLLSLMMLISVIIQAQDEKGIRFENNLSWKQIQAKAKAENKYIFVDCFTTWCRPCLTMEKYIYPLSKVGDCYNDKFISIKVQIDTSKRDNEDVKKWYADALYIKDQYQVNAFPTFLFFSPEGNLVHREAGGKDADLFISIASDALNPKKQYYRLLAEYQEGRRDTSVLKQLAYSARAFNNKVLAQQIATDYISTLKVKKQFTKDNIQFLIRFRENTKVKQIADNYINSLNRKELFTKETLELIKDFMQSSKDRGFIIFYRHADKINKMFGNKYAKLYVENIITKEEIDTILVF